tara:strand:+ start:7641 stop:8027 length:387 start_codon:yes stop_codon:yes gene_type:complete
MNESLLVGFLSFVCGYIFKTIAYRNHTSLQSATFVDKVAKECLILIGTVVYKVSYIDQLHLKMIESYKGKEDAKIARNELQENFQDWKKLIIEEFQEHYPEDFKYQLEFDDWKGAMDLLTDIYNEKKV